MTEVRLPVDQLELIADLIAARLGAGRDRLVDPNELAAELGVDRSWIYENADRLGALRLGGAKGRMRFDPKRVRELLAVEAPAQVKPQPRPRRRKPAVGTVLKVRP